MKLLEATDAPDLELLPPAEKIALASQKRERGNAHYQRGDYAFAVNSYSIALQITESSSKGEICRCSRWRCIPVNLDLAVVVKRHYQLNQCSSNVMTHHLNNNLHCSFFFFFFNFFFCSCCSWHHPRGGRGAFGCESEVSKQHGCFSAETGPLRCSAQVLRVSTRTPARQHKGTFPHGQGARSSRAFGFLLSVNSLVLLFTGTCLCFRCWPCKVNSQTPSRL